MRLMKTPHIAVAAFAAAALILSGCSAGSLGSTGGSGGKTTLTFLVDNAEQTLKTGQQLAKDFSAKNPDITIKVETRPQGTDGDNLVKTRLATGTMDDVFEYNTGSLFPAMNPPHGAP